MSAALAIVACMLCGHALDDYTIHTKELRVSVLMLIAAYITFAVGLGNAWAFPDWLLFAVIVLPIGNIWIFGKTTEGIEVVLFNGGFTLFVTSAIVGWYLV